MGVFDAIGDDSHEEIVFGYDPVSGLRTIIAIHSTALGPALGGTRFFAYANEDDALSDVLRLSKGMTYKAAVAGLDLGGGKAVIIGDPAQIKSERLLRAYGQKVDSLGGRYITAEDVGTTTDDMAVILKETPHVAGLGEEVGGSGDPSPATARGVLNAMHATARHLWGDEELSGRTVAIQGIGKVGGDLMARLHKAGAHLVVTDVNETALSAAARGYDATVVGLDEIYEVSCDIFAPCALGASLSAVTIPRLRCAAVVGSANNQLAVDADADRLAAAGILYAPDFVVNAGGIINIATSIGGYDVRRAAAAVDRIFETVTSVLNRGRADGVNPHVAAIRIADERLTQIGTLRRQRLSHLA